MKKILVATAVAAAFGVSGVQAAEDITVDVAVIGAGGAGLSAAVEAANLGAKVVVVEKMGMPGGNTIRAAGGLNAAGTALQQAKGTKDSVEIAYFDTMKGEGKAAGKDAFGRADMPRNLDQAPFYAIMVTPAVHHTMGGIKIDSKTQVYNTKGQVVPGLFAAGEITGGVHGGNRLGGNAQADIVTFGRIAGQQSYIYAMQAAAADKAKK